MINNLLNVLVCSFLCIRQNTAKLVEILSDATHKTSNKMYLLKTLFVIT